METNDAATAAVSVGPAGAAALDPHGTASPVLDLVVPVHNEAHVLDRQITRLHRALADLPFSWRVTIAENGSTDGTSKMARHLAGRLPATRALCLHRAGRGNALKQAWSESDALVCAYTDVDLSTSLRSLVALLGPLLSDEADITFGSRLLAGSHVVRSRRREVISRWYSVIMRTALGTAVHDAQCGFKAVRSDLARALLPEVEDGGWFFDTELLVRAERRGYRLLELPIHWVEDPDSRVRIVQTARDDLRGITRLVRELGPRIR
jgi:glycosyltransferase involved in cell wall biosynthesis